MRGINFAFGFMSLVVSAQAGSEPSLSHRMGQFGKDAVICRDFLTGTDAGICSQVADLANEQPKFKVVAGPVPTEEGQLSQRCYYLDGKLKIVELEGGELLTDTIGHYYVLDDHYLFVTEITTPHKQFLQEMSEKPLTAQDLAPRILGFLFRDMTLKRQYSRQGVTHPSIPKQDVEDALSDYRSILGLRADANSDSREPDNSACLGSQG